MGWITLVSWTAWALSVGLVWIMYRLQVMHPNFLPLGTLMAVQVVSACLLAGISVRRLVCRQYRLRALGWLLLGSAPVWLWATHLGYASNQTHRRNLSRNLLIRMSGAAGAALIDADLLWRYPHRITGRHVRMLSASPGDFEQVRAMDRHVDTMDAVLGRPSKSIVHWVRGPAGGLDGRYFQGIALGSTPGDLPVGEDGLCDLDRHEVAHFVISQHCGPDSIPPFLLIEGWAEAYSGYGPGILALRAWRDRQAGRVLSLRQLVGPDWYDRGLGPVYQQGGPLVEYIVAEFGGETFLELYTTCRRESFESDCRRVLGIGLDELDRRYWRYVDQVVADMDPAQSNPLLGLELADEVDPEQWRQFATQYPSAVASVKKAYQRVCVRLEGTQIVNGVRTALRYEFVHDQDRHRMTLDSDNEAWAAIATGNVSAALIRPTADSAWRIDTDLIAGRHPYLRYESTREWIHYWELEVHAALYGLLQEKLRAPGNGRLRITGLRTVDDALPRRLRIEFETVYENREPWDDMRRAGWFELLPDHQFALAGLETRNFDSSQETSVQGRTIEYQEDDGGGWIPSRIHTSYQVHGSDSSRGEVDLRVVKCEFGPQVDQQFEFAQFGVDPPRELDWDLAWYVVLSCLAAVSCLLMGAVLVLMG